MYNGIYPKKPWSALWKKLRESPWPSSTNLGCGNSPFGSQPIRAPRVALYDRGGHARLGPNGRPG